MKHPLSHIKPHPEYLAAVCAFQAPFVESAAMKHRLSVSQYMREANKHIQHLANHSAIWVRVNGEVLGHVLQAGAFKTVFDHTGADTAYRREEEHLLFGIPLYRGAAWRPLYGYWCEDDCGLLTHRTLLNTFGHVAVRLGEHVRASSTALGLDAMLATWPGGAPFVLPEAVRGQTQPSPAVPAPLGCMNARVWPWAYQQDPLSTWSVDNLPVHTEAHIHRRVDARDVVRVVALSPREVSRETLTLLEKRGIPLTYAAPPRAPRKTPPQK